MGRKKADPPATPAKPPAKPRKAAQCDSEANAKRRVRGKSGDALPDVPWVPPSQRESEQGKLFWDKWKKLPATPGVGDPDLPTKRAINELTDSEEHPQPSKRLTPATDVQAAAAEHDEPAPSSSTTSTSNPQNVAVKSSEGENDATAPEKTLEQAMEEMMDHEVEELCSQHAEVTGPTMSSPAGGASPTVAKSAKSAALDQWFKSVMQDDDDKDADHVMAMQVTALAPQTSSPPQVQAIEKTEKTLALHGGSTFVTPCATGSQASHDDTSEKHGEVDASMESNDKIDQPQTQLDPSSLEAPLETPPTVAHATGDTPPSAHALCEERSVVSDKQGVQDTVMETGAEKTEQDTAAENTTETNEKTPEKIPPLNQPLPQKNPDPSKTHAGFDQDMSVKNTPEENQSSSAIHAGQDTAMKQPAVDVEILGDNIKSETENAVLPGRHVVQAPSTKAGAPPVTTEETAAPEEPDFLNASPIHVMGEDQEDGATDDEAASSVSDISTDSDVVMKEAAAMSATANMAGDCYPPPPSPDHPNINRLLQSAAEIMLQKAIASNLLDVEHAVRSLPRSLDVGDYFTGAATFHKVMKAAVKAIKKKFKKAAKHLKAKHSFMAEWIPFKQKFIMNAVQDHGCCLFSDATKIMSDDRECVRHSKCCDLVDTIVLFNGGFSCKSFSKLHPDYHSLLTAMQEENQDSSSVVTFQACIAALEHWEPPMFILENVDLAEDSEGEGQGNLELIVQALQAVGYAVRIFKLIASDFGLPTGRVRLYFGGYHQKKHPEASFDLVEKLLTCFKLKSQKPEDFMLPDDEDAVTDELNRRIAARAKADRESEATAPGPSGKKGDVHSSDEDYTGKTAEKTDKKKTKTADKKDKGKSKKTNDEKDVGKWQVSHMSLAESRGIKWPLEVPRDLQDHV